jgi:hypothetical protein
MTSKANLFLAILALAGLACWMQYAVAESKLAGESMPSVSAIEILAKINDCSPVDYDAVVVVGDLDLASLDERVSERIKITNSRIRGPVHSEGLVFDDRINFCNTTFEEEASFSGSSFRERAGFERARFLSSGNFSFVTFSNIAAFDGAQFLGPANFILTCFDGLYADFTDASFRDEVSFESSRFNAYADLQRSQFKGMADFHMTRFGDSLALNDALFNGQVSFMRSQFSRESWFYNDHFLGPVDFKDARFDGPIYFDYCRFDGPARFMNSYFNAPANFSCCEFNADLDLNGSRINNLLMKNTSFNSSSRIFLRGASINQMMMGWEQIQERIYFDPSAYLALIKNYRDLGRSDDANDCYYDYRSKSRANKGMGLSKFLDTVAWLSCGYGVRPHYALLLGLGIIIFFAILFWLGSGHEELKKIKGWPSILVALYYSALAFTANAKGLQWSGRYRYLGMIEGIMGWLVMALFLVTLGRIMIG